MGEAEKYKKTNLMAEASARAHELLQTHTGGINTPNG